ATSGELSLASNTGLVFSSGTGSADTGMTFAGTVADINTALNGLNFSPAPNFVGSGGIEISVDDLGNTGAGGAMTSSASVGITMVDKPPTVATAAVASPSPVTA